MSATLDDTFFPFDDFPDRLERGQDGMDLSRLEPGTGLVYTGLGGVGQRLRYIVLVAVQQLPVSAAVASALESHWQQAAHAHHSKMEALTLHAAYLQVTLLIPMDVAPDDVVQAGLAWRGQGQLAFNPEYFITNVAAPSEADIATWLKEIS